MPGVPGVRAPFPMPTSIAAPFGFPNAPRAPRGVLVTSGGGASPQGGIRGLMGGAMGGAMWPPMGGSPTPSMVASSSPLSTLPLTAGRTLLATGGAYSMVQSGIPRPRSTMAPVTGVGSVGSVGSVGYPAVGNHPSVATIGLNSDTSPPSPKRGKPENGVGITYIPKPDGAGVGA